MHGFEIGDTVQTKNYKYGRILAFSESGKLVYMVEVDRFGVEKYYPGPKFAEAIPRVYYV